MRLTINIDLGFYEDSPPEQFRADWESHPESSVYFEAVYLLLFPLMREEWWHGTTKFSDRKCLESIPKRHKKTKNESFIFVVKNGQSEYAMDDRDFINKMNLIIHRYCGICWYIRGITYCNLE